MNQPVGSAFDKFKKSLPKDMQIGDNYRLEVAWTLYGQPQDYEHALWEGLIQPINEAEFKLPSIGNAAAEANQRIIDINSFIKNGTWPDTGNKPNDDINNHNSIIYIFSFFIFFIY